MADTITREELHHRQLDLRFYNRSDGMYEVVGRLIDTKTLPFQRPLQSAPIPAGEHLHDISVHLVLDAQLVVQQAWADMPVTPFDICPQAASALTQLEGLRIGGGWNKKVRELLGGAASCTHVLELLGPMATAAWQGISPQRLAEMQTAEGEEQRLKKIDSCYAYGADREVVARLWPQMRRED